MGKYRQRSYEVDAVRFTRDNAEELEEFAPDRTAFFGPMGGPHGMAMIETGEGVNVPIRPGDWVVRGEDGTFWTCKHEVFFETYERAR